MEQNKVPPLFLPWPSTYCPERTMVSRSARVLADAFLWVANVRETSIPFGTDTPSIIMCM